ncbi:hypothetical protein N7517_004518 [Penicillium concentricum]|uniref:Uncharacterized protein n=1 Tax=Penicillium concentricum TaxID=293559 RepID=A0A9W9S6F0_9EURO|nr:uncharacterized protein N7517_004518 [Penicillium concentricum]KAJ5372512.1 hypothetical protein N7517_004518 [Penicillium concentricum]
MEDLPMDDSPAQPHQPHQPFDFSTGFTGFHAADPQPEETEHSTDDSGPSTPTQNTHPFDNSDDDIRVIKPYDIEEPDDELESSVQRVNRLCLPDRFERWQRDLTDYLDDMDDQPVGFNRNKIRSMRKRGQKRKPTHNTPATQQCNPPFKQRYASAEIQPQVDEHLPKRRRVSEPPQLYPSSMDSFGDFREPNANESSSSETQSMDLSGNETMGNETMNNSPMEDEMDLD